jgi:glutathione-regulated potassium-efflux system ancillary protein KefG
MDMTPWIDSDDLLDAHGVAEILGLAHRNTVSQYQRRYGDMPRPIVNLGGGRTKLWLRSEIAQWAQYQAESGRTRPARRSSG